MTDVLTRTPRVDQLGPEAEPREIHERAGRSDKLFRGGISTSGMIVAYGFLVMSLSYRYLPVFPQEKALNK